MPPRLPIAVHEPNEQKRKKIVEFLTKIGYTEGFNRSSYTHREYILLNPERKSYNLSAGLAFGQKTVSWDEVSVDTFTDKPNFDHMKPELREMIKQYAERRLRSRHDIDHQLSELADIDLVLQNVKNLTQDDVAKFKAEIRKSKDAKCPNNQF